MKKLNKITITAEESATLQAAQTVAETIYLRHREANGGYYGGRLEMRMEVKEAADETPHVWWTVHPWCEHMQTGHNRTLESALAEMHGHTDPELKRHSAERYRVEADRLDDEANKLEAANADNS